MASSENSSPSKFLGKPWSVWGTYALSPSTKVTDPVEISHAELGNQSPSSNSSLLPSEDDANVMKLKIEDKPMFGICPMRDECYLVFCSKCERFVKSQAMTKHYQLRHGRPPDRSPDPDSPPVQFPEDLLADHIPSHSSMPSSDSATIQSCAPLHRRSTSPLARLHSQEELAKSPAPEIRTKSDSTPIHRKHQIAKPEPRLDDDTTPAIVSIEQDAPGAPLRDLAPTNDRPYRVPHVASSQLSPSSGNITDQYQVSSEGKSPLNHMLPVAEEEGTSPKHHKKETTLSSNKPDKDSKKSVTPPNPSKPKKPTSRKRKSSGIKNEKNIPCKDRQFDANKHCGVWIEETQRPCTHSLTCKTHSLSLRRAVKGRRASFDELLAEHKKISDAERAARLAGQQTNSKTANSTSPKQAHIHSSVKSESMQRHKTSQSSSLAQQNSTVVLNSSVPPPKRSHNSATRHSNSTSPVRVGASSNASHRSGESSSVSHSQSTKVPVVLKSPQSEGPLVKVEADSHGPNSSKHTEQLHAGHPLPSTMCTFGAKTVGEGRQVFSRRMFPLRKAFLCLLEQQLNPQLALAKKQGRSQEQKHAAKLSRQSSAPASSKMVANSNISQLRTVDDSDILSSGGVSDNMFRGSKGLKRPASDAKANTSSKAQKVNQIHCMPHLQQQKNKVRRKSVTKISKMTQNMTAANSTSSTTTTAAAVTVTPNVVSVVPSNGIQAIDLSQGLYSIDATSEIPLSVLKSLRFVVTNIDANANGGQNASQGGVAVPILGTVGGTQLVIGNVGGTVVPHDGKMNIKSRPKHAVGTKVAFEKQAERSRRPSGQSQHMIVPNQYLINASDSNTTVDKSAGQSILIPSTTASSQIYRQNSSSAQVSSPLPNGIVSTNSSQVYTLKSLPTSVAMNCIQGSEKSPSRSSTPSPCANSTETSPVGLHPHYTSGIQSQSAKNSSSKAVNNSQKSISKKPSGVALQAPPNVTATAAQLPIQLQPLQFHQTNQISHQIMANIIATDAQGKPVPLISATNPHLIPSLSFPSGQSSMVQGMMALAGEEGKGAQTTPLLQQQPTLALSIPQQGTNPPVRLQGPSLSSSGGQSQSVLSTSSEVR